MTQERMVSNLTWPVKERIKEIESNDNNGTTKKKPKKCYYFFPIFTIKEIWRILKTKKGHLPLILAILMILG